MDPSGPAQPPKDTAYETQGNPVSSNPSEQRSAQKHHQHAQGGKPVEDRFEAGGRSSGFDEAVPSSLGRGIRGAPAGEERFGHTQEQVGRGRELDGDQMRAPGEGEVASAVERKPGATGSEPDLASDLDRKKQEQASKRAEIKEDRKHGRAPDDGDARAGVVT